MHDDLKLAFKDAILNCLPLLHKLSSRFSEPHLVWEKRDGGWHGQYQAQASLRQIYDAAQTHLEEHSAKFNDLFFANYPAYRDELVGCAGVGINLAHDKSRFVGTAINALWDKHSTFDCNRDQVDSIVTECAAFVDLPTVRIRYQVQLLNFRMDTETLLLAGNLRIRKLSEKEISILHGGPLEVLAFRRWDDPFMNEFVVEGDFDEPKVLQSNPNVETTRDQFRDRLNRLMLSLRTFKDGPVGYGDIRSRFLTFCPFVAGTMRFRNEYVPLGEYTISNVEMDDLCEHARWLFTLSEASMETACFRLSAAATRTRPQDQLVDAVIGMEALLLAGLRSDDRRGELKYRFSLHYSTLFESAEERHRAFRVAKDLYDHRSSIAHGGEMTSATFRLGDERLTLTDAAKRATETLRTIVRRFLPLTQTAPYKRPEFWERAYFGVQ